MADIYDISSLNYGNTMDTDIGLMNMDKMITVPSFVNPYFGSMNGVNMVGKLDSDKVEIMSQKEKDKRTWGTIFTAAAVIGAGVCAYKFGKTGLSKLWTGMKNLANNIMSKFKKTP